MLAALSSAEQAIENILSDENSRLNRKMSKLMDATCAQFERVLFFLLIKFLFVKFYYLATDAACASSCIEERHYKATPTPHTP